MASQSTIGIIGAMDVEVALLKKQMQECGEVHTTAFSGMEFIEGVIGQTSVVVVKCGVGMVNAATCTQILIDRFGVGAVLNTGIAGSLDAAIEIGDVVVATDAVNHIMDVSNLGYAVGQTPGADTLAFPMNEKLSCAVVDAAAKIGVTTHRGRVASGDRFVCSDSEKHKSLWRQMLRDGRRRHRERVPPFEHSLRNRARNFRQGRRVIERRLSHLRSPSSTSLRRTCDPRNLEPRIKRVRYTKKAGRALSASGLFVRNQDSLTPAASINDGAWMRENDSTIFSAREYRHGDTLQANAPNRQRAP